MDSQILDRNYEEDPHSGIHSVTEGEDEHHREKTSVLKKVKAKARKIKETLTKHGHGHGHDQEHDYHRDEHGHDREFDEEDDEEDEMAEGTEVHGAPMYESAAIRSTDPGHEEKTGQPRDNLGGSAVMEEDHHAPMNTPVSISPGINQTKVNDMARNFDNGQEESQRQHGGNLGRSTVLEEDPHAPKDRLEEHIPANYQTKVTDPTGAGEEAGVTSILRSFGKMGVNDETEQKTEHYLHTGSHDQFSPELAPPTKITDFPQNPQTSTELDDRKTETQPNQSTYTEKISSATSVIADKAISAKNVVASKLGYGEKDNNATPDMQGSGETTKASQVGEYGRKIAATVTEKLAPVYDKVAEAGRTVASKMPGTGTGAVMAVHESAAIRSTDPGHEENIGRPRGNLGGSAVMEEDHHAPMITPVSISPGINQTKVNDMARNFDNGQGESQRQHGGNLGRLTVLEKDPHSPKDRLEEHIPANYQTKVTDPTGAGGEEAGITSILRSFGNMGVDGETEQKTEHYLHTGSHDQFSPELAPPTKITDFPQNPQSSTELDDSKAETQPNQSTYTEKISSATSVIADKAISAKNVVASKLGYGEKDNNATPDMQGSGETTKASQVGEYGRKIAATVTEKLAPVYDKVAEAGSTVASKMPGTGTGAVTEGGVKGPNKGVSVKEYLVEKLRPGDEDKALSEVISDALGKCKENRSNKAEMVSPRPVAEAISDALHKRKEEDEAEKVCRPIGKVTESEEVAKSLGTGDEDSGEGRVEYSGNVNPVGKGVVDRVKGVVGSWLGKGWGDQSQTSQTSLGSTYAGK